jgi:hypothetical protein
MALLNLIYRDQLVRHDAYRRAFERLLEKLPAKFACRVIGVLLALAHEHGCEAELVAMLAADLAAAVLPDLALLSVRSGPDPGTLPEVVVHLAPLITYEALLGDICCAGLGEAA